MLTISLSLVLVVVLFGLVTNKIQESRHFDELVETVETSEDTEPRKMEALSELIAEHSAENKYWSPYFQIYLMVEEIPFSPTEVENSIISAKDHDKAVSFLNAKVTEILENESVCGEDCSISSAKQKLNLFKSRLQAFQTIDTSGMITTIEKSGEQLDERRQVCCLEKTKERTEEAELYARRLSQLKEAISVLERDRLIREACGLGPNPKATQIMRTVDAKARKFLNSSYVGKRLLGRIPIDALRARPEEEFDQVVERLMKSYLPGQSVALETSWRGDPALFVLNDRFDSQPGTNRVLDLVAGACKVNLILTDIAGICEESRGFVFMSRIDGQTASLITSGNLLVAAATLSPETARGLNIWDSFVADPEMSEVRRIDLSSEHPGLSVLFTAKLLGCRDDEPLEDCFARAAGNG
jgi:hypothetical protein